jgi:ribulose kinase
MPTTPGGLPYPNSTDPVANGAQDIQDLAEAVDNNLGLWLVKTQTATSGTVLNITNCFNSDFDNYRVIVSGYRLSSSASGLTLKLGTGTAVSSAYYWAGLLFTSYAASPVIASHGGANVASFEVPIVGGNTTDAAGLIEIYSPNKNKETTIVAHGSDSRVGGAPRQTYSGFHNGTNQFTSLHIAANNAFASIHVAVYGYRK